jgi:hypothetical protein
MNLADLFQSQLEEPPKQAISSERPANSAATALSPIAPTAPTAGSLADKPVEIVLTLLPGVPFSTRRIKGAVAVDGNLPLFLTTDAVASAMLNVLEQAYGQLQQQAEVTASAENADPSGSIIIIPDSVATEEEPSQTQGALSIF